MNIEDKMFLVKRKPTEEVLTEKELLKLFESEEHPQHYIGFEISGMLHIGSGLLTAMKIKDFIKAGIRPTIWLADYHSWINKKLGGDLSLIREIARGYFKAGFVSLGLDESQVRYALASEHYDQWYWVKVIEVMKSASIQRMLRCVTIMGRKETEVTESAALLYPAMQAADIFHLKVQLMHAGMDQRKVHVLTREIAEKMKRPKPVAVHTHLLMGLQGPQKMGFESNEKLDTEVSSKMSKSSPKSCIYIHDSEKEISEKIGAAYCPEKQAENNPIIELCEYIIMRDRPLHIERNKKYGGDVDYVKFEELRSAYAKGELHPTDLKNSVAKELSEILKPSREYFNKHSELLDVFKGAKIGK
ncbi:tyrosine--tRNA ligase [Candidatus Micrarchaeota archaeon]|nr:tyrosine--tRNA ligase [Candidatus Micrarchaeota archaeon]